MENNVAQRWIEFLAEEGYRPRLEAQEARPGQSLIRFKAEGTSFIAFAEESDPDFFHLAAAFDTAEEDIDVPVLLLTANDVNNEAKVVKTIVATEEKGVHFHVESFLGGTRLTPEYVERAMFQLHHAVEVFFSRVRPTHAPRLDA